MDQRVSMVTLGVRDIERAKAFYRALGWRGGEASGTVFFQSGGMAVVLWGRAQLAADANIVDADAGFSGIALAHNVRTRSDVDVVLATATAAGAEITRPAAETFYGGYAGYFRDPDGHLWEIAHNPHFTLDSSGNLDLGELGRDQMSDAT